jgi:hypothetical protein
VPSKVGHAFHTNLTVHCHVLATVRACDSGVGLGSPDGGATMRSILNEVILFFCVLVLFVGIVLTAANFVS